VQARAAVREAARLAREQALPYVERAAEQAVEQAAPYVERATGLAIEQVRSALPHLDHGRELQSGADLAARLADGDGLVALHEPAAAPS
jgi:hypothetical protein